MPCSTRSARPHRARDAARPTATAASLASGANADEIETPFLQLVMTRLWECELAEGSRVLRTETLERRARRRGDDRAQPRRPRARGPGRRGARGRDRHLPRPRHAVGRQGRPHRHRPGADDRALAGRPSRAVLDRLYEERIVRAVDPAPGTSQARYEIFHDRLAAPILDWRDQQENARLDRARQRAEHEAETQRHQARRFKRRAGSCSGSRWACCCCWSPSPYC